VLNEQLVEVRNKAKAAAAEPMQVQPITFDASGLGDETQNAIAVVNMLNSVMGAFKQQVKDARKIGEEEGRKAVQHEFEDVINKARNDGYRDAMTYLDDRVTTARDSGAREERARIANMGFFERRRYLHVHVI
jgi:hypothetical protein